MKENKLPTAEEFYKKITGCIINHKDVKTTMIEFAKLHVAEAQKAWFDKIKSEGLVTEAGIAYLENAYPLDLIK